VFGPISQRIASLPEAEFGDDLSVFEPIRL
jgi:hypothetical protein